MALFATHADDAVLGSIAMQHALHAFNAERPIGESPIRIGIGLHTGFLMLGTVGGHNRMDGTVISDAVNLASRVEGLTKRYGVDILITAQTYQGLEDPGRYAIRIIDRVQVKGKTEPVTIYEVFDGDSDEMIALKKETLSEFEQAILSYNLGEFSQAMAGFEKVLTINPQDEAAKLYLKRCEQFQKYGLPPNWDGVAVLTEK